MIYWVYVLHCDNDSYYTGYTVDLLRRYREHCTGHVKCKYTRSFKPLSLVQCWAIEDNKTLALKLERAIKRLPRHQKEYFLIHPEQVMQLVTPLITT